MNKLPCDIIKDLMPLYVESLVSDNSAELIESHLEECSHCRTYCEELKSGVKIEVSIDERQMEDRGAVIVKRITQTQERIKYTFILFAMFVAVGLTLMPASIFNIVPGIIIIPLVLRLFYKESLIILLSAFGATLVLGMVNRGLGYLLFMLPVILICTGAGVMAAKLLQNIFSRKE
jgi:hypothetical protein